MFELHSTGVALLCFFCCLCFFCFFFICLFLLLSLLFTLLSSADAAGVLLFCFMANVFASLGSAIKPGWVSDYQGERDTGVGRMQCSTWCKIDAAQSVSDNSKKRSSNSNNNIVVSGVINISVDILWVAFFFFFAFRFPTESEYIYFRFFLPLFCTFSYVLSRLLASSIFHIRNIFILLARTVTPTSFALKLFFSLWIWRNYRAVGPAT